MFWSVLLVSGFCLNYRISVSDLVSEEHIVSWRRAPVYFSRGVWLIAAMAVYLGYRLLQSWWLLDTLLVIAAIAVAVATFLRYQRSRES